MYARSTTVQGDPQRIDEGIAYIRDEVMPAVQGMAGCMGLSMLCARDTGRAIVTTSWDSEESMSASREAVRAMREQATDVMGGQFDVQEWEVAVMHRTHNLGEGAWARVIFSSLQDVGRGDEVLDAWKTGVLPRLDEYDGFSSVSVMVDRATGQGVTTVCFDDRGSMEASREMGERMREEFGSRMGVETTEMLDMEIALHHLRVPELV